MAEDKRHQDSFQKSGGNPSAGRGEQQKPDDMNRDRSSQKQQDRGQNRNPENQQDRQRSYQPGGDR